MKIIVVNPENRTVKYKEVKGGLDCWYEIIGCRLIEFRSFEFNGRSFDVIFDEEGSFNTDEEGMVFATQLCGDNRNVVLGKFVVVGSDMDSGDTIDVPDNVTLEFLIENMKVGKIGINL